MNARGASTVDRDLRWMGSETRYTSAIQTSGSFAIGWACEGARGPCIGSQGQLDGICFEGMLGYPSHAAAVEWLCSRMRMRRCLQVGLFLLFLEVMLRATGSVQFQLSQPPTPPLTYAGQPVSNIEFRFENETIDADSVPNGNKTPVRTGNELRVVGFGDSFIRANGADYTKSLLPRVGAYLNQQTPDRELQLYNLGEPSSFWEMDCRYWDVGRSLAPDIVLWVYVLNDIENAHGNWDIDNDLINDDYLRENQGLGLALWDTPMRLWWRSA